MGAVPRHLVRELQKTLNLERAVETGTFEGRSARRLAEIFPQVFTIELSAKYHRIATAELRDVPNVECKLGRSVDFLQELAGERVPSLYWLDAHWTTGDTAGRHDECPLLEELEALETGDPRDCLLIDDASLFATSPPPPHDPQEWPSLGEIFEKIRTSHPDHHVTIVSDIVIAVPSDARKIVDDFARHPASDWPFLARLARHFLLRALARVRRWAGEA